MVTGSNWTQKRKPKNPIKFKINLNEEQKDAKAIILENPVNVLKGAAGSGKTLLKSIMGTFITLT